jgi:hypothetical protein
MFILIIFLLLVVGFTGYVIGEAQGQRRTRKALGETHRIELAARDRLIVELRSDRDFEEALNA